MSKVETIGRATLYLGDCVEVMPGLAVVDHIITDPPYEKRLHDSKNSLRGPVRVDSGPDLRGLVYSLLHGRRNVAVGRHNQRQPHEIQARLRMGEARLDAAT